MIRISVLAFGVGCTVSLLVGSAQAAPSYRYCAEYEDRGDITCAYDTFAQCMATAGGGAGGNCRENPSYRPPAAVPRRKLKPKTN